MDAKPRTLVGRLRSSDWGQRTKEYKPQDTARMYLHDSHLCGCPIASGHKLRKKIHTGQEISLQSPKHLSIHHQEHVTPKVTSIILLYWEPYGAKGWTKFPFLHREVKSLSKELFVIFPSVMGQRITEQTVKSYNSVSSYR